MNPLVPARAPTRHLPALVTTGGAAIHRLLYFEYPQPQYARSLPECACAIARSSVSWPIASPASAPLSA
jgi:hypothetical protein